MGHSHPSGSLLGGGNCNVFHVIFMKKRSTFLPKWSKESGEIPFLGSVFFFFSGCSPAARPPGQWLSGAAAELHRNRTQLLQELAVGRQHGQSLVMQIHPGFPMKMWGGILSNHLSTRGTSEQRLFFLLERIRRHPFSLSAGIVWSSVAKAKCK